jgi:serine/threonine protein kinase
MARAMTSRNTGQCRLALPAEFRLAEYRIIQVLGQGGFGITYLGEDTQLHLKVAIKELLPVEFVTRSNDATVVLLTRSAEAGFAWAKQRFIEEAQILIGLNHPSIVRAFRLMELNGTAYLVMEFVRGSSLREWVIANPSPSEAELEGILSPLLDGLEYIHRKGLVHRDISPDNILIRDSGSPLFIDFGSARSAVEASRNFTSVVRHGFSPIEQYQARTPHGCYTDIYALAGTMIYAMTGEIPPRSVDRVGDQDIYTPVASRCRHRYSTVWLQAIDSAFAAKPGARPQTVANWRRLFINRFHRAPPARLLSAKPASLRIQSAAARLGVLLIAALILSPLLLSLATVSAWSSAPLGTSAPASQLQRLVPRKLIVPAKYPTLQAAFEAAQIGDTVVVTSGSGQKSFTVTAETELRATDREIAKASFATKLAAKER